MLNNEDAFVVFDVDICFRVHERLRDVRSSRFRLVLLKPLEQEAYESSRRPFFSRKLNVGMLRGRQVRASIVPSLLRSNEQLGF